ncbi:Rhs family protein [Yersinia wautersii]|uniref:Rhs family protein n=2 Tax=Yersinia wautersii TaxID=1341643 RepID=A0ABP1ZLD5_9GAMM|nr:Rhs family protein [Yersinia wautersii]
MRYGMLVDEVFTMDAADNLLNSHSNGQYRDNRLTQREGFFCEYDAWGNMTEKRQGNEQHYFAYDGEHRLIAAQGVGHQGRYKAHYHYDGLGRRIKKAVETRASAQQEPVMETTDFIWQGLRLLQERHQGECQTYLYDPLSPYTPLALARHYADTAEAARTATLYYYHTELNGAPLDVTNEAGQTVWSGEYKSWGAVKRQTLAFLMGAKGNGRIRQPLRYAGQYHDEETGLHYNTFRYYDPKIGRFTTQDPIGLAGGMNLYAYAPNPITWIDPWGLAHLNTNGATGNFGVYKIEINGELYKYGKADLNRITQSSELPTRLHQQVRKLQELYPDKVVKGTVIDKWHATTASAKAVETAKLDAHYKSTGQVPDGNKKSYKPSGKC